MNLWSFVSNTDGEFPPNMERQTNSWIFYQTIHLLSKKETTSNLTVIAVKGIKKSEMVNLPKKTFSFFPEPKNTNSYTVEYGTLTK